MGPGSGPDPHRPLSNRTPRVGRSAACVVRTDDSGPLRVTRRRRAPETAARMRYRCTTASREAQTRRRSSGRVAGGEPVAKPALDDARRTRCRAKTVAPATDEGSDDHDAPHLPRPPDEPSARRRTEPRPRGRSRHRGSRPGGSGALSRPFARIKSAAGQPAALFFLSL